MTCSGFGIFKVLVFFAQINQQQQPILALNDPSKDEEAAMADHLDTGRFTTQRSFLGDAY